MPSFVYFLLAVAALIAGYAIYSRVVVSLFGIDELRPTPASTMADGVDYVKLPPYKLFLIQLLNIAGVGPVFGPILGALYGPSALLWIVLGSIFAGGLHDYFAGMMSLRYNGKSIPDVVGYTLGDFMKQFMRVFSIILLVLVGVVFVNAPAGLLAKLTPDWIDKNFWVVVIFIYYFLATVLPIDVIIGRLYPLFAVVLIIMAVGVGGGLIVKGYAFYEWPIADGVSLWANQHPEGLPMWPLMFVTIACGALSGFHATQSPLMSRCAPDEKCGRSVFYGAMIAEGIIALIWATAGMTFYPEAQSLLAAIKAGTPSGVVNEVCLTLLGPVGGVLAILGVVVLPITSGDTAFRAARLVIADFTKIHQDKPARRLWIAVPLFAIGGVLSQVDFNIVWRYFGWSNQTLATVVLWSAAAFIVRRGGCHWLASLPATFMTAVVVTYLCVAPEGFKIGYETSVTIGLVAAALALGLFLAKSGWFRTQVPLQLQAGE
ncbi:MAG: carbon starvation protein A [Candidatus Adiutrix sp.]|jgi:carbon starvation protein CstA|nr:carbon starvation protein A [Candidatus Adiutrix sp.]